MPAFKINLFSKVFLCALHLVVSDILHINFVSSEKIFCTVAVNYTMSLIRFISFCLYITGFVWFVLSLVKKYYMRQFSLFAWTHVTLLIIVTQSYLILQNLFEGLIW